MDVQMYRRKSPKISPEVSDRAKVVAKTDHNWIHVSRIP